MDYVIIAGFCLVGGFLMGRIHRASEDAQAVEMAELDRKQAFRELGRLSRRIFKQRTKIKELTALVPPEVMKLAKESHRRVSPSITKTDLSH
jgi:hypothetical protein